jgi:hypothetical protein
MAGQYDPAIGSFALKPTRWVKQPRGIQAVPLDGLVTADGKNLKGRLNARGCGDFLLVRGTGMSARLGGAAPPGVRLRTGGTSFKAARSTKEECDALLNWSSRIREEYPNLDPWHTQSNLLAEKVVNLYRDKYFVPVFGERFVDMSAASRKEVSTATNKCNRIPEVHAAFPLDSQLGRAFRSEKGSFGGADIVQRLEQIALVETWGQRVVAALPTIPESPQGFAKIQEYLEKGKKDMTVLFPSEAQAFAATVQRRQAEVARVVVDEVVARPVPGPPSLDSAKALADLRNAIQPYLPFLKDEDRKSAQEALGARLDGTLASLVQADLQRAQSVPATLQGLPVLAGQIKDFEARYAPFSGAAPVQSARGELAKHRAAALGSGKAAFAQEVKRDGGDLAGLKKMNTMLAGIFALPSDRFSPSYREYAALLDGPRAAWIDRQLAAPAAPQPASGSLRKRSGFKKPGYKEPEIVAAIFIGDFVPLQEMNPDYVEFYLRHFAGASNQMCPQIAIDFTSVSMRKAVGDSFDSRDKMASAGARVLLDVLQGAARPHEMMQNAMAADAIAGKATSDAQVLLGRYNGCSDDVRGFFSNAAKYAQDHTYGVPLDKLTLADLCVRGSTPAGHSPSGSSSRKYCGCAMSNLASHTTGKEQQFLRRDFATNLNVLKELRPGLSEGMESCPR